MSLTHDTQMWSVIDEFPDYEVSSWGLIFSHKRRCIITPTRNNFGDVRISLVNSFGRFTRSVAVLVATAFVPAEDTLSNMVILLDGDKTNVAADNLAWRPRSFAWRYARQLRAPRPRHYTNLSVVNMATGVEYPSIEIAGMTEGLLFQDIWRSTYTGSRCYPHRCTFEVSQRV